MSTDTIACTDAAAADRARSWPAAWRVAAAPALGGDPADQAQDARDRRRDRQDLGQGGYEPGETIAYTITVTNAGGTPVPRAGHRRQRPAARRPGARRRRHRAATGSRPGRASIYVGHAGRSRPPTAAPSPTPRRSRCARPRRRARPTPTPPTTAPPTTVDVSGEACAPPIAVSALAKPVAPPSPSGAREALPQAQRGVCPRPKLRAGVTAPRKVRGREAARFTIAVRNAPGAAAARRAHLTVRLPAGLRARDAGREPGRERRRHALVARDARPARGPLGLPVTLRADRTASGTQGLAATVSATLRLGAGDGPGAGGPGGREAGAPPVAG